MAVIEIGTIEELIALSRGDYGRGSTANYLDVALTKDLDFSDLAEYGVPYSWGGCTGTWYINFDGRGHTVDNIYYSGTSNWAFFNTLGSQSTVKNLKLTNAAVTTTGFAGTFYTLGKEADNVHVSGSYTAGGVCCGIAYNFGTSGGVLKNSGFSGQLTSTGNICTGLVYGGGAQNPAIFDSYVYADLQSGNLLLGMTNTNCPVFNSYVRGSFKNNSNQATYMFDSSTDTQIGCYGAITASNKAINAPAQINSFYDSDLATAGGYSVSGGLAGATTAQLKNAEWLYANKFPS